MRRLEKMHVPRVIAAMAMITVLFISLVSMGTALSGPAHDWANKTARGLPRLRERLSVIAGPVESAQHFLRNAESYIHLTTTEAVQPASSAPPTSMASGLSELLFAGTASFASGLFIDGHHSVLLADVRRFVPAPAGGSTASIP